MKNNKLLTNSAKNNFPNTAYNLQKNHSKTITKISNQNEKILSPPIINQFPEISKVQPISYTSIQTIVTPSLQFQNKIIVKEVISDDPKSSEQTITQADKEKYIPYKKRKINFVGNTEIIGTHQLTVVTKEAKAPILDCSIAPSEPTKIIKIVKPVKEMPKKAIGNKEKVKKATSKKATSTNDNKTLDPALAKYNLSTKKKFKLIKKEGFPSLAIFKKIISSKLVKFRDSEQNSLLHIAAAVSDKQKSLKYAKVITTKKCDIDCINSVGNSALHIAEEKKNWVFANYLMTLGASRNIINDAGFTPDMINSKMLSHKPANLFCDLKEKVVVQKSIQLDLTNSDDEFPFPILVKRENEDFSQDEMDIIPEINRGIIDITEDFEMDRIGNKTL
ncbi:MAG: hypothetical protein H0U27_05215 [Nitrosopumilus sp.]|nr:hypothetical protein [Nitrosopumilus sp.]